MANQHLNIKISYYHLLEKKKINKIKNVMILEKKMHLTVK